MRHKCGEWNRSDTGLLLTVPPIIPTTGYCAVTRDGFVCTRQIGHRGRHLANGIQYVAAVWR